MPLKTLYRTWNMSKKDALGKGIRALLENIDSETAEKKDQSMGGPMVAAVTEIPLSQIEVNPFQPRADFDPQKLQELSSSINVHGVIQPITVRRLGSNKFQLIAGERRLRAAKLAGLEEIPAYVRTANDQEMLEIALIENIQRENLNAVEVAINYQRLIDECDLTQEALAGRVGKERSTVTNYLRLLKLPPEIQKAIKEHKISMGHARALINLETVDAQLDVFKQITSKNLSVRQVESLVRVYRKPEKQPPRPKSKLPLAYQKLQDQLASNYSTKVTVKHSNSGKGEIVFHYYSDDDLNRLLEQLDA